MILNCAGHHSEEFPSALRVRGSYLGLLKSPNGFEVDTLNDVTITVRQACVFNPDLRSYLVNLQRLYKAFELHNTLGTTPIFIQPINSYISDSCIFEATCNTVVTVHELSSDSNMGKAKAKIK